jgi:FkbM family methyltransferase
MTHKGDQPLKRLTRKLSLYAREAAFAASAPASFSESLDLMRSTVTFHYRNWRRLPLDPGPRLSVGLAIGDYPASLTIRPQDGDLAVLYEVLARHVYAIPPSLLPPEAVRTVVDAGANIGLLYFAARYPRAKILSIEPNPDNFALLAANTRDEPRIEPVQACLTPEPGQQVFIKTSGPASHFKMNRDGQGVAARGMNLDELCAEHGLDRIDLLKMDIEGAEKDIFADVSFLPRVGVIVAELHGRYDLARFNADLAPWGFTAWVHEHAGDPKLVLAARKPQ